jgi:L-cysteine:1D-myo-inositol 2-amino-2-deoxy-alpha-D-glucopyranoside ligase
MSKSLGNLVFVSKLRDSGVDPMAIRLAILAHHYRSDWEWTPEVLTAATARLTRWRAAVSSATGSARAAGVPAADDVLRTVRERLAEDLDAPGALAAVDAWAGAVLAAPGSVPPAEAGLIRDTADALLGIALWC